MSIWNKTKSNYPRRSKKHNPALDYYHICETCKSIVIFVVDKPLCATCGDTNVIKVYNDPLMEAEQDLAIQYAAEQSNYRDSKEFPIDRNLEVLKTPVGIAIVSAIYNVENATPENKAWAEKRLQEELKKARGIDWSKVPEVIQPNEINWGRFIEGTDWDE